MGKKPGQGRGGLAQEQATAVNFKMARQKVQTRKGAIIGQFLVDGEQVKGQTSKAFAKIVTAAERDATDAIERDRIPRQYQKAIKSYFSTVQRAVGGQGASDESDGESATDGKSSEGSSSGAEDAGSETSSSGGSGEAGSSDETGGSEGDG